MKYTSTRSNIEANSLNAVLEGIAKDGGLYISPSILSGSFDWKGCLSKPLFEMIEAILSHLLPDFEDMSSLVEKAYRGKFETDELTPVVKVGDDFILELFRGPTSAFKDVALSMLPHLISQAKKQTKLDKEIVILTATSGDTGKAALEGFKDVDGTRIVVFYPHNGVSPVQKAQMASQEGKNVRVCAVRGNFDDCQTAVKKAFIALKDKAQEKGKILSSANSINIGRLAPQVTYYFKTYKDLVDRKEITLGESVDFIVPTGNFGDILAGYFAKLMGLPVGMLVCAANENNVLTDFINTGIYDKNREFVKTQSPSMDILVSSNLERLLYLASGNNASLVSTWMKELSEKGKFQVDEKTLSYVQKTFDSFYCTQEETQKTISQYWNNFKYLCDPHTAVAVNVAEKYKKKSNTKNKVVILSTASPYKFPNAVLQAIDGKTNANDFEAMKQINKITNVSIPKNLSSLENKKERFSEVIDGNSIISFVEDYLWK